MGDYFSSLRRSQDKYINIETSWCIMEIEIVYPFYKLLFIYRQLALIQKNPIRVCSAEEVVCFIYDNRYIQLWESIPFLIELLDGYSHTSKKYLEWAF